MRCARCAAASTRRASGRTRTRIDAAAAVAFSPHRVACALAPAAGRGFAVVATEVRSLAQRSAEAAKEIKQLITQSMDSVARGRRLVDAAEATMGGVVTGAGQVTEVIDQISNATSEQSAAVQEINRAIVHIDDMTQQNAALVEEAAGSAAAFQEEAARLLKVVDRFKADRGEDRGRIVALVRRAAKHVRKVGPERACADFNDSRGAFVHGEDYVFAFDLQGTRLAYSPDLSLVGKNFLHLVDADGCQFVREMVAVAAGKGYGWVEYRYPNPRTRRIEPKSVYVQRVGGLLVGCGIYRSDAQAAASPPMLRDVPRLAAQAV